MQSNSAIASSMCLDTMYGLKPDFFKRWPERIEKITREEVNAAAKKYLLPEKMVEITVGPERSRVKGHGSRVRTKPVVASYDAILLLDL